MALSLIHIFPPFLEYGKAVASPPHPCKVLGFHPKPHKPFEKGLSENFTCLYLTLIVIVNRNEVFP